MREQEFTSQITARGTSLTLLFFTTMLHPMVEDFTLIQLSLTAGSIYNNMASGNGDGIYFGGKQGETDLQ